MSQRKQIRPFRRISINILVCIMMTSTLLAAPIAGLATPHFVQRDIGGAFNIVQDGPDKDVPLLDSLVIGALLEDIEGRPGLHVVDVYQEYIHITAPSAVIDTLSSQGYDVRPLANLDIISFDAMTFDVREGEPQIPANLRDDGTDIFIVQMRGPTKKEWMEELAKHGTILDIVQYHAYIMRISPYEVDDVEGLDYVSWVGRYHPFYKIRFGFEAMDPTSTTKATIVFFKDDPEAYDKGLETVVEYGGKVLLTDDNTDWWNAARIEVPLWAIGSLARLDGVNFIEPYDDPVSRMNNVRWVVQSYDAIDKLTPIWDHGINGTGIIVGGADTGIDYSHIAFRNSTSDVGTPGPNHRKIVQYNTSVDDYDNNTTHGTHTMGAIIGNNVSDGSGDYYLDGIAFEAKIAFYDVVHGPGETYDPPIMTDILQDAYYYGAKSHSDSWGDDTTAYTARSQRIDQFQWDNDEFITFIAPGNGGVVWEPATAKNCISVGNSYNGETKDIASSSAVGPANGNMINPHLIVPGMSIHTPVADSSRTNSNDAYAPLSGTSMSTPVAAGSGALVEQYFKDGFYPTGTRTPADGFDPSGPLKKAALLNSGWDQYGGMKGGTKVGHAPNNQQGWGKVLLDDVLYFQGDNRSLWIYDGYQPSEGQGLMTGEKDTYIIHANSSEPFEVTLVWNDYPGQGLKNDLDLTVMSPNGTLFRGNRYANGASVPDGVADGSNPTESVLLAGPEDGFYLINVTAINIQSQVHQRYSIVVTGSIQSARFGDVNFDRDIFGISETVGIRVVDSDLAGQGAVEVSVSSLTETTPETLTLTEGTNLGIFHGVITLSTSVPAQDGVLQVRHGDTIAVRYDEADPAGARVDIAVIDAEPPEILNVRVVDISTTSAIIRWETDEPANTNVTYGPSPALGKSLMDPTFTLQHEINLIDLLPSTLYFFDVASMDMVKNREVDTNNGTHYSFRTASFIIKADPGYVGWVREGETFNHFTDGLMYSGYFSSRVRYAAMMFNMSGVPDNADVVAATVRLYGRSRVGMSPDEGTWSLDLLPGSNNEKFNATSTEPSYADIADTPVEATIGQKPNPQLIEGSWTTFEVGPSHLDLIEERLKIDGIVFKVRGPEAGGDNMFAWDTGHPNATNTMGVAYAPQLIITVNLIPTVSPNAPDGIEMEEDSSYKLDLGTIFTDDGPLSYNITRAPLHFGDDLQIENATLNLTPEGNWNGEDHIIVKAIDNDDLSSQHRINITVNPINDQPHLIAIDGRPVQQDMVINGTEDELMTVSVLVDDVDVEMEGDLIFLTTNVSWLIVNGNNITFTPSNDDVGEHHIQVIARDIEGASDQIDAVIFIRNVNDPPVAQISRPTEGFKGYADTPIQLNASTSFDIDEVHGDRLSYTWSSSLISGDLGDEEVIYVNLTPGEHRIKLIVTDVDGAADFTEVNITIWGDTDGDGTYDPEDDDDDGDGMPDYWESTYGLDPLDPNDADLDNDLDKVKNLKEYQANTDPTDPKSRPKATSKENDSWFLLLIFIIIFLVVGMIFGGYHLSTSKEVEGPRPRTSKSRRRRDVLEEE